MLFRDLVRLGLRPVGRAGRCMCQRSSRSWDTGAARCDGDLVDAMGALILMIIALLRLALR